MGGGKKQLTPVGAQQNLVDAQGSPLKLAGVGAVDLQLGTRMFQVDVLIVQTLTEDQSSLFILVAWIIMEK